LLSAISGVTGIDSLQSHLVERSRVRAPSVSSVPLPNRMRVFNREELKK
jgi:hypothetical protein